MSGGLMNFWNAGSQRRVPVTEQTPVPVFQPTGAGEVTAAGSLEAQESAVTLALPAGQSVISLELVDEELNFTGTLVAELSTDGGALWQAAPILWVANEPALLSSITNLVTYLPGYFVVPGVPGATHVRARMAVGSSGSMGVVLRARHAAGLTAGLVFPVHSDQAPRLLATTVGKQSSVRTLRGQRVERGAITTTDAAYSAGDCIGGKIHLSAAAAYLGAPVVLRTLTLKDDKNAKPDLQILFFRSNPTGTYTDNAAVVVSTADLGELVGMVAVAAADWKTIQGQSKAFVHPPLPAAGLAFAPASGTGIYMVLVAVSTPDYAANSTDLRYEAVFDQGIGGI